MAWEQFKKGRDMNPHISTVRYEGRFATEGERDGKPPRRYLYLNRGLAQEIGSRDVELWFHPSQFALGIRAGRPFNSANFKISDGAQGISLARMADKSGFLHVFDGRTVSCSEDTGMYVFHLGRE